MNCNIASDIALNPIPLVFLCRKDASAFLGDSCKDTALISILLPYLPEELQGAFDWLKIPVEVAIFPHKGKKPVVIFAFLLFLADRLNT